MRNTHCARILPFNAHVPNGRARHALYLIRSGIIVGLFVSACTPPDIRSIFVFFIQCVSEMTRAQVSPCSPVISHRSVALVPLLAYLAGIESLKQTLGNPGEIRLFTITSEDESPVEHPQISCKYFRIPKNFVIKKFIGPCRLGLSKKFEIILNR